MDRRVSAKLAIGGLVAGLASGLLGVGGGIVLVPVLVLAASFGQHRAHATSLAAVVPIAIAGMAGFAIAGEVDLPIAAALSAGSVVGVPLGARAMHASPEGALKIGFGLFLVVVGIAMVVT